ncbi:MAG: right-handed parallel beta-helix repeat-containing protein [Chloroflexota bacterium]|nr:right-handed parallel beta-helix repeat-containing protein [Chloroflexota bacterium]
MNRIEINENRQFSDLVNAQVTSAPFPRTLTVGGSNPIAQTGARVSLGADTRHCLIQDVPDVGWWAGTSAAPLGGTMYDVVVRNVGWKGPDRGHGHPLYCQNYGALAQKTIDTCVFIAGFSTAGKVYLEGNEDKISNVIIRDSVFVGSEMLIGGIRHGARDVLIENCVFINCNVRLGFNARNSRVTFRNNVVFGNLTTEQGDDLVIENNAVIVRPPYRLSGMTYGAGAFGISLGYNSGVPAPHSNIRVQGNIVYTDSPNSAFNGWGRQDAIGRGVAVGNTQVHPLAEYGARSWSFAIPERQAETRVEWNPAGAAEIPLAAWRRVRDVRRWDDARITNRLTMSGAPTPPRYWTEPTAPPIPADTFPQFGVFRIEAVTDQEIIMTLTEQIAQAIAALQAAQTQIVALDTEKAQLLQEKGALVTANAELIQENAAFQIAIDSTAGQVHTIMGVASAAGATLDALVTAVG